MPEKHFSILFHPERFPPRSFLDVIPAGQGETEANATLFTIV